MNQLLRVAASGAMLIASFHSHAFDFSVSTASEFQSALTTAASNGGDDVITLAPGVYPGNFKYLANEAYALTIQGDPNAKREDVILDGERRAFVLRVDAREYDMSLTIQNLTVANGKSDEPGGGLSLFGGSEEFCNPYVQYAVGTNGKVNCPAGYEGGKLKLINLVIRDNFASGGAGVAGGSSYISYDDRNWFEVTIEDSVFSNNGSYINPLASEGYFDWAGHVAIAASGPGFFKGNQVLDLARRIGAGQNLTTGDFKSAIGITANGLQVTNNRFELSGTVEVKKSFGTDCASDPAGCTGTDGTGSAGDCTVDPAGCTGTDGTGTAGDCTVDPAGCAGTDGTDTTGDCTVDPVGCAGTDGTDTTGDCAVDPAGCTGTDGIVTTYFTEIVFGNLFSISGVSDFSGNTIITDAEVSVGGWLGPLSIRDNRIEGGLFSVDSDDYIFESNFLGNLSRSDWGSSDSNISGYGTSEVSFRGRGIITRNQFVNIVGSISLETTSAASVGSSDLEERTLVFSGNLVSGLVGKEDDPESYCAITVEDQVRVVNNTIARTKGAGLCLKASDRIVVANNIVWPEPGAGDGYDIFQFGYAESSLLINNIFQTASEFWDVNEGNLNLDPQYFDVEAGDLHVRAGSPAINAGAGDQLSADQVYDLDGNARVLDGVVDIGAYERSTTALHPADTNGDNEISSEEFAAYNAAWRANDIWETAPALIPIDYVSRAGYLLQSGGKYENIGVGKPATWVPVSN
jgi:hypothetical protein